MKIYTKTGDKGTTRLVDGSCVEKHNPWVEAYGCVDELNSYLGIVISDGLKLGLQTSDLEKTQHHLFRVGSLVAAGPENKANVFESLPQIDHQHIEFLEHRIDQMTSELEPLKSFILPSGHSLVAHTHFARTLCRRAERRVSEVYAASPERLQHILVYLNRLSDYLFTLARYFSLKTKSLEVKWDKNQ
jgi:cob(I)alamin adenosyltransferase